MNLTKPKRINSALIRRREGKNLNIRRNNTREDVCIRGRFKLHLYRVRDVM